MMTVPLYQERYWFLTPADGIHDDRDSVTWAEVGSVPLCLLTPDMQKSRIIDQQLQAVGGEPTPIVQSNSRNRRRTF